MASTDDVSELLHVPELTTGARRILEAASELFYRRGIHAVGVDTIAAESGVTKRTLYDRFGSKDRLVAAYLQVRHQRWWERMEQRVTEQSESPVLALIDSYLWDSESSDRGCAFLNAAAELPFDHPGYRVVRAHKQAVRQRLAELVVLECPSLGDPDAVAAEAFLLLEGGVAHRGIDGDEVLLRRARQATRQLMARYGAEAAVSG